MSGISSAQHRLLVDYARSAFGSGLTEGKDGGRGFMGVYTDGNGKTHTIKILTHSGEGGSGAIEKLTVSEQAKIDDMTRGLRSSLVEIARCSVEETMKNVCSHLKLDEDGEATEKTPRLIDVEIAGVRTMVSMRTDLKVTEVSAMTSGGASIGTIRRSVFEN